jgi:hypothetical protein
VSKIVENGKERFSCEFLPRVDVAERPFRESTLQRLLEESPGILPVEDLRAGVGQLLCIGREVSTGRSKIDNLYLSTGGYVVCVETKLWRNPEARREVLAQALEYSGELTRKDYDWLEEQWRVYGTQEGLRPATLHAQIDALDPSDALDPADYRRCVEQSLRSGDVLLLIVGDAIHANLQRLVDDVFRISPRLTTRMGLVELAFYPLDRSGDFPFLVVPKRIQEVQALERAFIRIDVAPALQDKIVVTSTAERERKVGPNEQDFTRALRDARGAQYADAVQGLWSDLVRDADLRVNLRPSTLVLKLDHPVDDEKGALSVFAIRNTGRLYNPDRLRRQCVKLWGLPEPTANLLCRTYWKELDMSDSGFNQDGIRDTQGNRGAIPSDPQATVPLIRQAIMRFVDSVRAEIETPGATLAVGRTAP